MENDIKARSLRNDPDYVKCPRCRTRHTIKENYDSLCDKCTKVLVTEWTEVKDENGVDILPLIKQAKEVQRAKYLRSDGEYNS